jgi:hypothetical protein
MVLLFLFQDVTAPRCAFYGSENRAKFMQCICCVPAQINNKICKSGSYEQYVSINLLSFNNFVFVTFCTDILLS